MAFSLMLILTLMALPVAHVKVQREQERRLRQALQEIRTAIDRYKDMADADMLSALDPDNYGYPESLDALVEGVELNIEETEALRDGLGEDSQRGDTESAFGSDSRRGGLFGSSRRETDDEAFGSARDPFRTNDGTFDPERDKPETIRFLRQIPMDPMTGQREWGLVSVSDDPMSRSWSGRNVFDIYSLSNATAIDGTRYSEW